MLSFVSSLALLSTAPSAASDEGSSFWHIGNAIATIRVCGAFGYAIDQQGLTDWAGMRRDAIASENEALTEVDGQSEIEQAATAHAARIYAVYWRDATRVNSRSDQVIEKQYRFVKLYRKTCETLALSPELGAFLTAPDEHLPASRVIASITQDFQRARVSR